jgi:hypothetical protein
MSSGGGAEDIEIVVNKRKTLDEAQALKLLSTFLDKDQEKKAEDQVCSYLCQMCPCCMQTHCTSSYLRRCAVAIQIHPVLPFISPLNNNLIVYKPLLFEHTQIPSDVLHQLQTVRDNLQGGASHHDDFDEKEEEEEEEDESSKDHHQQPPPAQQQQQQQHQQKQERIEPSSGGSKEKEKKDKKKKKHKKDK